jgi:hypothetical protein
MRIIFYRVFLTIMFVTFSYKSVLRAISIVSKIDSQPYLPHSLLQKNEKKKKKKKSNR